MKQVAQMLGVKFNEEFNIEGSNHKYKISEDGIYFYHEGKWYRMCNDLSDILTGKYEIIKKPILDEAEKKYLSNVIKPFRNEVKYILKRSADITEAIRIECVDCVAPSTLYFPRFKKGTMYKGMETDKEYSLEELEL